MDLPHDDALRWIVTQYARLRAAHGEAFTDPVLVQPTGEHFPDEFARDAESVAQLLRRMISYAPLHDDLPIALRFLEADAPAASGGCGTGGCGTGACSTDGKDAASTGVTEVDDGYILDIPVANVGHATVLTSHLARALGALVLAEAEEYVPDAEAGAASEVAALACGFGVLLLEGAHIYGKSCGGVRMQQATSLDVMELGVGLALFTRVHGVRTGIARGHLSVTQAEAFDHALEWVDSNPEIVRGLRDHPEALAAGLFTLNPVRGFFGRLFGRTKEPSLESAPVSRPRRVRSPEEQRRLEEARALVDEALGDG